MPIFRPRIAIIGGGPGGLGLGRLLHQRGIRATIYELRAKPTQDDLSKVSGMLDLHKESGQRAIRECGLWDAFEAAVGDCSEENRVLNFDGTVQLKTDGGDGSRPEIPRNALSKLLIESFPADSIKWDHKVLGVRSALNASTGATEVTLDLGEKGAATYDLVVGADGAWSRVRPLLSDAQPFYKGPQFMAVTILHASTKYPHLVEFTGPGLLHAFGTGNYILTHRGPQDSIRIHICIGTPDQHWVASHGLEGKTAAEVKATLLGDDTLYGKWSPTLKDLIGTACDEETLDNPGAAADIKAIHMLPIGHTWAHQLGVTLLGDAAHLSIPSGEGVNFALWDALDLARVLGGVPEAADAKAWQDAVDPRMREFEETMQARGKADAEEGVAMWDMFLGENGAQGMADMMTGGAPPEN
ncbi:salicylate hydroxylase [Mycena polygramma]|nr:salicylate hydroxylase [Mycena polygramma]